MTPHREGLVYGWIPYGMFGIWSDLLVTDLFGRIRAGLYIDHSDARSARGIRLATSAIRTAIRRLGCGVLGVRRTGLYSC